MVRWNLILPASLLDKAHAQARREEVSASEFMRSLLEEATRFVQIRTEDPAARQGRMHRRR